MRMTRQVSAGSEKLLSQTMGSILTVNIYMYVKIIRNTINPSLKINNYFEKIERKHLIHRICNYSSDNLIKPTNLGLFQLFSFENVSFHS